MRRDRSAERDKDEIGAQGRPRRPRRTPLDFGLTALPPA